LAYAEILVISVASVDRAPFQSNFIRQMVDGDLAADYFEGALRVAAISQGSRQRPWATIASKRTAGASAPYSVAAPSNTARICRDVDLFDIQRLEVSPELVVPGLADHPRPDPALHDGVARTIGVLDA
jgi:hypothetical protein